MLKKLLPKSRNPLEPNSTKPRLTPSNKPKTTAVVITPRRHVEDRSGSSKVDLFLASYRPFLSSLASFFLKELVCQPR